MLGYLVFVEMEQLTTYMQNGLKWIVLIFEVLQVASLPVQWPVLQVSNCYIMH